MADLFLKHALRTVFVTRYAQFKRYLHMRLGSEELADDVLHETYLRMENMNMPGAIRYPAAYLYRMALNVAEDQRKSSARTLSMTDIEALYDMADELADPQKIIEGRSEMDALTRAMQELPKRRRAILIAARVDELPHRDIAAIFGISVRTVEKELRAGLEHCCARLGRDFIQRFGPGAGKKQEQCDE